MTDSLLRRGQYTLAPAQRRDVVGALEMCALDPVAHVFPAMHLETAQRSGVVPTGLWVVRARDGLSRRLAGVIWCGANLTAVLPTPEHEQDGARAEVASAIRSRLTRPAALVGEASLTLDLWGRMERWWGPARQVRPSQVSMAIDGPPRDVAQPTGSVEPLRAATLDDYDALLPAAVHMFVGEVGYDPLRHGRRAYEGRLTQLVREGRSYLRYGVVDRKRVVVFKAEVGVVGGGVAQIQGVWVHPDWRGRGLGSAGMAEVVRHVRADHAPTVSLYVNDFNEPALRTYGAVGFEQVGTFATVMF